MSSYENSITIAKVKDGTPGGTGPTGPQGVGITSVTISYGISNSETTCSEWQDSMPTATKGSWIWTRTSYYYSDATLNKTLYDKTYIGVDGQQGKSITRVVQSYLATASSSNITPSTSGWTSTIQTISSAKQYLWNFEKVYSGDSEVDLISSTDPVIIGRYGQDGSSGDSGRGITSISEYYLVTNITTTPTYGESWDTTPQVTTSLNRYLWNYELITYDKGSPSQVSSVPRIIGTHGATGQQGPKGEDGQPGAAGDPGISIIYVKELYYCTSASSASVPSQPVTETGVVYNTWTQICPPWTDQSKTYFTCSEIGYQSIISGVTSTWASWTPVISNGGYNTTTQAVANAQTSASQAATAAQSAQNAASSAQSAANAAATSAGNAQTAAQSAQNAASNAATSASNAQTAAQNAATSASLAAQSASSAVSVANSAYTSATQAYSAAQSASQAASSAVNVANAAQSSAASAYSLANTKNKTYAQNDAPTGLTSDDAGDLWIDTNDNNRTYRWDGSKWVDVETDGINLLYNSASLDITKTPYANSSAVLSSTVNPKDGEYFYQSSGAKYIQVDFSGLVSGSNYVFSFEGIRNASARNVYVTFVGASPTTAQNLGSMTSTTWTRYSKVFTATSTSGYAKVQISPISTSGTSTYIGAYRRFKLEKGNIGTDWTLAPGEEIQSADVEYYSSTSSTELVNGSWSTNTPTWTEGRYIWSRTAWKHIDGTITYSEPTCITGNTGAPGDAIKYEVGFSQSKILKFYENSGDNQSSKVFNASSINLWLDKIENGSATRLSPNLTSPDYKMNIAFYSSSVTIENLFNLLNSLTGKKNEGTSTNLLTVARVIHTETGIEPYITFNLVDLLDYIPDTGTSDNIATFNNFKEALDMSQGFFWIKFYSSDADTYPIGSEELIADCVIPFDFGTSEDMAKFRLTATSIQQSIDESKLIFDTNGLTILNGGILIKGQYNEELLSYRQESRSLYIQGNGVFSGTIYASDGEFTGTVHATSGDFKGTITAQQGSIGGFTIGSHQLQGGELILDSSTGTISGGTIHLTTSAIIDDYIELGNARIYTPTDQNGRLFIKAGSNSEILIKDNGIATFGGITINGSTSTITGANYSITPDISTFNNIVATGKIVTSVFESNKIQTVGGSMLFRPSYKISSISGATLTLDTDIDITTNINADDTVILVKADGNRLTDLFQISSINNTNKTVTLATTPTLNQGEVLNSIIILGAQGSLLVGINSTDNESSFLYPKGLTISEFSGSASINKPKVYLGDLTTLGMGFSGYGLYGDNVYLNGSLITINHEVNEQNYAGVNTLDGVSATIFGNSDTSNIIFWAGSTSEQPADIRQAKFQVTSKGSIYASQGKFTGSVISDTIISDSALYGTDIYGARLLGWKGDQSGSAAALEIWNTKSGILFKDDQGATTFSINLNGLSFPHLSENQNIIYIDEDNNNNKFVKFQGYSFSTDTLIIEGRTLQSNNNGLQNYLIAINENESNQILIQAGNIQSTFSPSEINLNQSQLNCGGDVTYGNMMVYKRAYESSTVIGYDLYVG